MTPEPSEKEIVQMLVSAAVAVANGGTIQQFCDDMGISTEKYYGWANRFGNVDLDIVPPRKRRSLWISEVWEDYREPFKTILGETLLTVVVMVILLGIDYIMEHLGYPPAKRETLEKIHYSFSLIILIMFACSSAIKMLILILSGIAGVWSRNTSGKR
jgi:hypothetical protein